MAGENNFLAAMGTVGSEKNSINYTESLEASGLRPTTQQMGVAAMASEVRPMRGAGPQVADLSGMSVVKSVNGNMVQAMLLETANVRGTMNPVVQFDIDNTGLGAANQIVRIGSIAAQPGAYLQLGLAAGAADNAVIRDQFGAGCLNIQGFSELISFKPVVINEIHIISSNLTQLNAQFLHVLINPDMIVTNRSNNIAFTQQKTDQKTTLNVAKGKWLLDSNQWLQFTSYAGQSVTILLHMVAIANVSTFTPVQ